jgi:D-alanine-D-alanine ligase-like ATP-grasp enzyme
MLSGGASGGPVSSGFEYRRRQLSARLFILRRVGLRHAWRRRRLKERYARISALNAQAAESMWRDAAAGLGAEVRRLSATFLEFELHGVRTRVRDQMTTALTDRVSHALALKKPLAYQVLADAGVPVPEHAVVEVMDVATARRFFEHARPPLIVKPASGGGGSGIVGNVHTFPQLNRALVDTGRFHAAVLVEEQAQGDSYRLLFLEGQLLDVVRRPRPRIVGDGVSTIENLMFREYERRIAAGGDGKGFKSFEVDLDSLFALDHEGLGLGSVLQDGESIVIKSASNYACPEEAETVPATDVPGIVEPARAAAGALGVRLAGVDVITTNPQLPLLGQGFVLEVNPVPGLMQHYHVADAGAATPVAAIVLAGLLPTSAGAERSQQHPVAER